MDIRDKLQEDMKLAMKAGQKDRLTVIRMLLSDVKKIDLMPNKPSAQQVVEAYAKKLRKSAKEYEELGKPDEVAKLKQEIAITEEYLPKKASPKDTERLVDDFLAENTFTEKQFGQAMGAFMKAHGQEVDAGAANQLLKKKLAGMA
ncbi:MAG TPA: GatB/YqeY domain-containing protein [Tepidisphaeraceae bacterium]